MAVSNVSEMTFTAKSPCRFLLIEVPLKIWIILFSLPLNL
jgi:hypothetical protein